MELFTYLLNKLKNTPDGDGTLLDHMTMIYGSGMADADPYGSGNSHDPHDIPFLLLGGGAGHLKGGRHIRFPKKDQVPLANLHLTLLDQFGVHWDHIGDSNGRIDDRMLSIA
jgi:hypothetical protein